MPNEFSEYLGEVGDEFANVDLGDKRRNARLRSIVERVAASPTESFPDLVASTAEREALYRLLSNEDVHWEDILRPHTVAAATRGAEQGVTRVVHDTTDFVFSGDREGLGTVMQDTKGFFAHVALAVSGDEGRIPLGVVGLIPYVRRPDRPAPPLNERKLAVRRKPRAEKESSRWDTLAASVSQLFPHGQVIHVMDQEADDFFLFAELKQAGLRYVIRGTSARLLHPRRGTSIQDVLDAQPCTAFRTVPLTARAKSRSAKDRKMHPARAEREAQLELRWAQIDIARPLHAQSTIPTTTVWVVQVFEPAPPAGEAPIQWTLITTEQVEDADAAAAVVDHYRARWRIEEYFRALKQGCAVQSRQLGSYDGLLRALAIFIPVAWRLMLLRSLGRDDTPLPAAAVLDEDELSALRVLCEHKRCFKLSAEPTLREAMLAIAAVGGHIRNNGEPGWIVLGRGFVAVLQAAIVWRAARKEM